MRRKFFTNPINLNTCELEGYLVICYVAVSYSGTALPQANGGTGLTTSGTANQVLGMNNTGTGLEYKTISVSTTAVSNNVGVTLSTANQIVINIPTFSATVRGVVPVSGGGTTNFLRADGTWAAPGGGGGITNTAANTELMMSNGTNAVPSNIFANVSTGSLTLGNASLGGGRTIETVGTGSAPLILRDLSSTSSSVQVVTNTSTSNSISLTSEYVELGGGSGNVNTVVSGISGISASVNGKNVTFKGGDAYTVTGNGNGGNVTIKSGLRRTSGSGTDGNITLDSLNGYLIISTIPTSSAGLPSGAVWSNAGVLNIIP